MSILKRAVVLALGFVSLASSGLACIESDTDFFEMGEDVPYSQPLAGGDSTGTNGLSRLAYQNHEYALVMATTESLATTSLGGSGAVTNPFAIQYLLSSPEGASVFRYAVGCALHRRTHVTYGNAFYRGQSHLLNTRGWVTEPLSVDAMHDLLTCMVAHVNPLGIEVPILLSGDQVADDGVDHSEFDVDEALWVAWNVPGGALDEPLYDVWPLQDFEDVCPGNALAALGERVCGQDPAACRLTKRTDRLTACVVDADGHYFCDGKPALKTTLSTAGFTALYGSGICAHY